VYLIHSISFDSQTLVCSEVALSNDLDRCNAVHARLCAHLYRPVGSTVHLHAVPRRPQGIYIQSDSAKCETTPASLDIRQSATAELAIPFRRPARVLRHK